MSVLESKRWEGRTAGEMGARRMWAGAVKRRDASEDMYRRGLAVWQLV
jgi:hypothetical protein